MKMFLFLIIPIVLIISIFIIKLLLNKIFGKRVACVWCKHFKKSSNPYLSGTCLLNKKQWKKLSEWLWNTPSERGIKYLWDYKVRCKNFNQ